MSDNLLRQMKTLKQVSSQSNRAKRRKSLETFSADPNFIKAVRELCMNLVGKHLPLSEECKKKLVPCKRQIKCCAKEGVSSKSRRKQIVNAESFLPHLVPYASSFLRKNKKRIQQVKK